MDGQSSNSPARYAWPHPHIPSSQSPPLDARPLQPAACRRSVTLGPTLLLERAIAVVLAGLARDPALALLGPLPTPLSPSTLPLHLVCICVCQPHLALRLLAFLALLWLRLHCRAVSPVSCRTMHGFSPRSGLGFGRPGLLFLTSFVPTAVPMYLILIPSPPTACHQHHPSSHVGGYHQTSASHNPASPEKFEDRDRLAACHCTSITTQPPASPDYGSLQAGLCALHPQKRPCGLPIPGDTVLRHHLAVVARTPPVLAPRRGLQLCSVTESPATMVSGEETESEAVLWRR